jgi:pentatricopeptide repeat protein
LSCVGLACRYRSRTILSRSLKCTQDRVLGIAATSDNLNSRGFSQQIRVNTNTSTSSTTSTASNSFHHSGQQWTPRRYNKHDRNKTVPDISLESVILNLDKASQFNQGKGGRPQDKANWDVNFVRNTVQQYEYCLEYFYNQQQGIATDYQIQNITPQLEKLLLSAETTEQAFHAMLRCKVPTSVLSHKVREWERYIGSLGQTPLTDDLSLKMMEANGKAGNIGRACQLLALRKSRNYDAKRFEFEYAVTAIDAAGLYLRKNRNVYLSDKDQPPIDNPTRWLDAILLNMRQRGHPLSTELANRMLNTYASTGKSGKAVHYFYRVHRSPIDDVDKEDLPVDMARFRNQPVKVQMNMRAPPPYHKIPSQVQGKMVGKPGSTVRQLKLDRESDPDWSPSLTAAIAFADSLTHGACGHDPIELDVVSYSILIKACVNRGSLWRAMNILDHVMPSNGVDPDVIAYNTLLTGLSKVGDVPTMREYFDQMIAKNMKPSKETMESVVSGLLNLGDVSSAISVVQDCFNQHSVLPPYTTHLKILEFALARGLIYEAKRHVYFVQQLWKWERNQYHKEQFCRAVESQKNHPKLSKEALRKLFAYFGERLEDSDFF